MVENTLSSAFSGRVPKRKLKTCCTKLQIFCFTIGLVLAVSFMVLIFKFSSDSIIQMIRPESEVKNVHFHKKRGDDLLPFPPAPSSEKCNLLDNNQKFNCHPEAEGNQASCEERGCCWAVVQETNSSQKSSVPSCYYPQDYAIYKNENITQTNFGETVFMRAVYSSAFPKDIQYLKMDVIYEKDSRLHIKIYDPLNQRFEPPYPEISTVKKTTETSQYHVELDETRIGFKVIRKSDNRSVFDCLNVGGFIFSDQFLQLSAKLPTNYIYGLGEHRFNFLLDTNWVTLTMFNHDQAPEVKSNLYGSHPFYLAVEPGGKSTGTLILNSNAMDVILQPTPAITYRTIGGILDFYVFLGPTPSDVIDQYTELIGRPAIPPYWSLGFHLCRWGYTSLNHTKEILEKNLAAGIPLDVQWSDIDYMDDRNDFTYDHVKFKGLDLFVDDLHKRGMHYVMIVDPGLSGSEPENTYPTYDEAVAEGVLVKDHTGKPFVGKVWNSKTTVFVDFLNPGTFQFWTKWLSVQRDLFKFDGLWIDMNEPANMLNGSIEGCPSDPLEDPPYLPALDKGILRANTLCMTAKHYKGLHYDLHNLYALAEAAVTHFSLVKMTNKRPFILSRASFAGQGKYGGVWSGDNWSTWDDLYQSIPDILNMNIFGVPLTGVDICGFHKNTTIPLCQRWQQLGAFYPFSRNHNSIVANPQDPATLGPDVVNATRKALTIRYTLLPYLYTLFWQAHIKGETVARSLLFEFPADVKTYNIDKQFLWGPALLINPVLTEGVTSVKAYLPKARWFDYYTKIEIPGSNSEVTLPAPLDTIPLLLRGGHILPTQVPASTTTMSRKNNFGLTVVPDESNQANGMLYWDDGESIDTYEQGHYNHLKFSLNGRNLASSVVAWKYETNMTLGSVDVLGVKSVASVSVNGNPYSNYIYKADSQYLKISNLSISMNSPFSISWSYRTLDDSI